jgi:hypothetical protein
MNLGLIRNRNDCAVIDANALFVLSNDAINHLTNCKFQDLLDYRVVNIGSFISVAFAKIYICQRLL